MSFLSLLAVSLLLTVAIELLRPKPKFPAPKPGEVALPNAEEGAPIPAVFGTCKVSPTVTWFGDTFHNRIEKEVRTGLFSKTRITVGYEYGCGMQLALCHGPVDALLEIYFGDYQLTKCPFPYGEGEGALYDPPIPGSAVEWVPHPTIEGVGSWEQIKPVAPEFPIPYADDGAALHIRGNSLFGGPELEGGVWGEMQMHFGSQTQGPDPYLATFFGADRTSHYRGICYAVVRRMVLGRSNYIKPMWFVVKRCPNSLNDQRTNHLGRPLNTHEIRGDANGAHILYEILTNYVWGLGMPQESIDRDSFLDVAAQLKTEELGLSMVIREHPSSEDAIREVLRHIDGVLYPHPSSGKLTLRLIRGGYNKSALLRITPQNARDLEFARGSWRETVNEIKLTFTHAEQNFKTQTAQAQNLASIQAMREVVSRREDYPAFTRPDVAQRRAEKLLKGGSLSLARASFKAHRLAARLAPGDPFILDWPPYGIEGLVMRVTRHNYGSLLEGEVEVEAVEDLFDYSGLAYQVPTVTPQRVPCGVTETKVI